MEDPRVTKCLTAKRESRAVEFKEQFDPTDNRQALEVLKDIVAICNVGGGTLAIGIDNAGKAAVRMCNRFSTTIMRNIVT
jgi:hypothetical protein